MYKLALDSKKDSDFTMGREERASRRSTRISDRRSNNAVQSVQATDDLTSQTNVDCDATKMEVKPSGREARLRPSENDSDVEVSDDSDDDVNEEEERPGAFSVNNNRSPGGPEREPEHAMKSNDFDVESAEMMGSLPLANAVPEMEIPIHEDEDFLQKTKMDAEAAFLSKVGTAEAYDMDGAAYQKRRQQKRVVIAIVVVAVIMIGVVIGVVLGVKKNETGNEDGSSQNQDVTATFDNITATSDTCDGALLIGSTPYLFTGSTENATFDDTFSTCGSVSANGAGVFFKLQGAGRPLSISTCFATGYDTQISVYVGDSCSALKCIEGNDQRTRCGRDGSQLTFLAEEGTRYFILLHGSRRASGVFTLAVEEISINNQCATATRFSDVDPAAATTAETTVFGSTKYSSVDGSVMNCFETSVTSAGAWFSFQAASSRFVQARVDDFSSKVSVFTGSCDSLQCVAASNVGMAMWTATKETEYLIFVHGNGKLTGDFALSILPGGLLRPSANVTNNICSLALPLSTPTLDNSTSVDGSTMLGLVAVVPGCGSISESTSKGMWYSVVGDGRGIQASTCDTDTDFVALVTVFQGDCLNLLCTDGGDQNCGDQSAVAWYGQAGVKYYILVQGIDESRTGDFTLRLEEIIPEVSGDCDAPLPVVMNGTSILGSTENGQLEDAGLCDNVEFTAPSVWYTVEGTGTPLVASTCDKYSDNVAKVEVYVGSCLSRSCVADVRKVSCGNQMLAAWDSSLNETYLVQVYGSGSGVAQEETFTLSVEELPANYKCPGAATDLILGSSVQGNTPFATSGNSYGCIEQGNEAGSWYRIEAQSGNLTISACSGLTSFQPKLTVFQGDACSELVCISTNNNKACGADSFVSWEALPSEVYYVLVQGGGPDEYGYFELRFGPENDICDSAIGPLSINGGPILGSTLKATNETGNNLGCFDTGTAVSGSGVWYTVVGNGTLLKASTCSERTSFDTQMSVYEGSSCSSLSCVAGNDNVEACGEHSSVTWSAELNKLYYLLIHGFEVGEFALMVSEVENDSCLESQSVLLTGDSAAAIGTNAIGESYFDPCIGSLISDQLGSWWAISGTGGSISVNVCGSDNASIPSLLSVYTQTCSNLTCQSFVENSCVINFETTFLEEYTILVSNNLTDIGSTFVIEIDSSNDLCGKAFGPLDVGDLIRGSTLNATEDDETLCGNVTSRGAGVWYSFIGKGEFPFTLFTCSEFTDFDTQLTLFKGDDCESLTCVVSKQGNCGTNAWLQYEFEEGEFYYILVSGKPGFSGNFVLQVA